MKWFIWLSVLLLVVHVAESGRILRTWRRQGVAPRMRLRPRPYSMWSFFRRPRMLRRNYQPFRFERREPNTNFPQERVASIQTHTGLKFDDLQNSGWRPVNHGNPIERDPTFHYAPPANDQVKFAPPRRRPLMGRHRIRAWGGPRSPHPFWKFLGYKQRRFPPHPPVRPEIAEEAEVTQFVPNIVYFQPNDVLPSSTPSTFRPGIVSDVPLYPTQASSPSEFKPMPISKGTPGKEFIFRVVDFIGGTPKKGATVLRPASSTPETKSTTQNSAPIPVEPTEAYFDLIEPPEPINSFNINIDAAAEGSSGFIKVVMAPETTSSTTTETPKPIFALRSSTQEILTEETTTFSTSTTSTKATIYKLPTMPVYKKKQSVPIFPRKAVSVPKTSREQMSESDMSSSIMITGIRSKVKEYKPQMLANYTQLLAFDKVSEATEESSTLASTSLRPENNSTLVVGSTSTSPMQTFDPLKMIHSWFMKT